MRILGLGDTYPHGRPRRVASCPPRGPHFAFGRPSGETLPPHSAAARVTASQHSTVARINVKRNMGFTLLELLLVVAIVAIVSGGVSFALRDSGQAALEREGQRLAALLESARARSQASGVPVHWRATATGFTFEGLAADSLPHSWLSPDVVASEPKVLLLGPEPIIPPQQVRLVARNQTARSLTVLTDGVRPFTVHNDVLAAP